MGLIKIRGSIYNLDQLVSAVDAPGASALILRFCDGQVVRLSRAEATRFREIAIVARARELVATPEVSESRASNANVEEAREPEVADELSVMRVLSRLVRERGNPVQVSGRELGLAAHVVGGGRLRGTLDRLESQGKVRMAGTPRTRRIELLVCDEAG